MTRLEGLPEKWRKMADAASMDTARADLAPMHEALRVEATTLRRCAQELAAILAEQRDGAIAKVGNFGGITLLANVKDLPAPGTKLYAHHPSAEAGVVELVEADVRQALRDHVDDMAGALAEISSTLGCQNTLDDILHAIAALANITTPTAKVEAQPPAPRGVSDASLYVRELARDIHYAINDDGLATLSPVDNNNMREAILRALQSAGIGAGVGEWQPIESAPKDGTWILVGADGEEVMWASYGIAKPWLDGWYSTGHRSDSEGPGYTPTHWVPLPQPPAASQQRGEGSST